MACPWPSWSGRLWEGVSVCAFLALGAILLMAARKEPRGASRWTQAFCGLAAIVFAGVQILAWWGPASPGVKGAGALLGLAGLALGLAWVGRWRGTPPLPGSRPEPEAEVHTLVSLGANDARILPLAQDLEDQVAARTRELREAEARLQGFIRHAPAAIAFKDLEGRFLLVNRRAEALIGVCLATTPRRSIEELFTPEVAARIRAQDERVLAHGEEMQFEESVAMPDGAIRDFLVQKFPLTDAGGRICGTGSIATDLTERKQAERAHLQRQKMESVGLLAGGIAHELNNLLGAMMGNVELARMDLDERAPVTANLLALEELIDRAAAFISQILAYAGRGKFQVQTLDLNLQVEVMMRLLRASLPRQVSLHWEPATGLAPLEGDLGQINQMIMNLVLNAAEAMEPRGGVITLRTGPEYLTAADLEKHFKGQALRPGPHLALEVADNGPGMPPEILERIFDPFFTTKFAGRGLGLSAVQGALLSHQGGLRVASEEGKGTALTLYFPASSGAARAAAEGPERRSADYRGSGWILVADDEDTFRDVAVGALRRLGFDTLEARDGQEALQVFLANRQRIRLVILDLTMPRMDGEQAYRELRAAGATLPVILTSGFGPEEAFRRFRGKGLAGFLQKPYRFATLVNALREALEAKEN